MATRRPDGGRGDLRRGGRFVATSPCRRQSPVLFLSPSRYCVLILHIVS
jgi:hypothetical protein